MLTSLQASRVKSLLAATRPIRQQRSFAMRSPSARFLLMTPIWFIAPSVFAEDGVSERLMPYVMFDVATEKDAVSPVKNEYFNKHITIFRKS